MLFFDRIEHRTNVNLGEGPPRAAEYNADCQQCGQD
jgi:hypothetical protein